MNDFIFFKTKQSGRTTRIAVCVLAFLIPAAVMTAVFAHMNFTPFGNRSILMWDMKSQYLAFFASLRHVFGGEKNPFFSFAKSLGENTLGLYAYYLASPFSWITCLFPMERMSEAIETIVVLKIGCSGLAFARYAQAVANNALHDAPLHGKSAPPPAALLHRETGSFGETASRELLILPVAVSYALMSYNVAYTTCPMWMDAVVMLPLVLKGVELLAAENKWRYLLFSLGLLFMINYYTGYMAAIFATLYFLFRTVGCERFALPVFRRKALLFAASGVGAALFAAPVLLPVYLNLRAGMLAEAGFRAEAMTRIGLFGLFRAFGSSAYVSLGDDGLPMVYCGYFCLLLALVFFLHPAIGKRERVSAFVLFCVLCAGFFVRPLNYAWHGFHKPMSFPYRFAFTAGALVCVLALRGGWALLSSFRRIIAEAAAGEEVPGKAAYPDEARRENEHRKDAPRDKSTGAKGQASVPSSHAGAGSAERLLTAALLTILVTADMGLGAVRTYEGIDREFIFEEAQVFPVFLEGMRQVLGETATEDPGLYRIHQTFEYSKNDALILDYPGVTQYASVYNAKVNAFYRRVGLAQGHVWSAGFGLTPLTADLLGVRYLIDDGDTLPLPEERHGTGEAASLQADAAIRTDATAQTPGWERQYAVYRNADALPLVYAACPGGDDAALTAPLTDTGNPFENQNRLLQMIADTEETFYSPQEAMSFRSGNGLVFGYSFTAEAEKPLYLFLRSPDVGFARVFVNDVYAGDYFYGETYCCLYLGTYPAGSPVTVRFEAQEAYRVEDCFIVMLDTDALHDCMERLAAGGLRLRSLRHGILRGEVTVPEGGAFHGERTVPESGAFHGERTEPEGGSGAYLLTSIPYDPGWRIRVDDQRVETAAFSDTFLMAKVSAGTHSVEMYYIPPGLLPGIALHVLVWGICVCLSRQGWRDRSNCGTIEASNH